MGATELPKYQSSDDHVSIDDRGHGAAGSLSHEKGNTSRDEVEMSRMGKKQELRAGSPSPFTPSSADINPANVQVCVHRRVRHHLAGYLGECAAGQLVRSVQRRDRRCDLVHLCCMAVDAVHDRFIVGIHCLVSGLELSADQETGQRCKLTSSPCDARRLHTMEFGSQHSQRSLLRRETSL